MINGQKLRRNLMAWLIVQEIFLIGIGIFDIHKSIIYTMVISIYTMMFFVSIEVLNFVINKAKLSKYFKDASRTIKYISIINYK